jgi:hypothetical protein
VYGECHGRAKVQSVSERVLQLFTTFEDAERADDEYYASLTPAERLEILLSLVLAQREAQGEASTRFERVYRVTQLSRL